jgi:enoyl-CoA hydratase
MIELTSSGDVAVLRLAHGKANAMSIELCEALTERLDQLGKAPAQAVVITGTGRMFSAGVDLLRLLDGGAPYVREFLPAMCRMFEAVFRCPKPIVAAVNGHAIAGGCVLACACDKRLMARDVGRIGVTELLVGVPFPTIAMEIMRCAAAPQYFQEMLLGGATYAPEEGAARGLVHELVEADLLLDRAIAAAQQLAVLAPAAVALTRRQARQPALERLQREGRAIDAEVTQIWTAPDTLDRIRDYVSRTFKKS